MQFVKAVFLLATIILAVVMATLPAGVSGASHNRRMSKLRRVRKDIRVHGNYFVHMDEQIEREQTIEFIRDFANKTQNDSTTRFNAFGIVDKSANGFSCEMSKAALDLVSFKLSLPLIYSIDLFHDIIIIFAI